MKDSEATCDTSVLVPALLPAHEQFPVCITVVERVAAIPAHVLFETYRVLTRMPGSDRVPPRTAIAVLESLAWKPLQLPGGDCLPLIRAVARAGVVGGPIYDAQIAATAKHHGLTLLSRDRRAATVYDLVGVDYELV